MESQDLSLLENLLAKLLLSSAIEKPSKVRDLGNRSNGKLLGVYIFPGPFQTRYDDNQIAISNGKVYVITHPVRPFWRMISVALKNTVMIKKEYMMCLREGLRNNIVLIVKQSIAINRSMGAANMKPRGLFDDIHEEDG
nr:hypothetical protein [Tanacetum cinerariifolium]